MLITGWEPDRLNFGGSEQQRNIDANIFQHRIRGKLLHRSQRLPGSQVLFFLRKRRLWKIFSDDSKEAIFKTTFTSKLLSPAKFGICARCGVQVIIFQTSNFVKQTSDSFLALDKNFERQALFGVKPTLGRDQRCQWSDWGKCWDFVIFSMMTDKCDNFNSFQIISMMRD